MRLFLEAILFVIVVGHDEFEDIGAHFLRGFGGFYQFRFIRELILGTECLGADDIIIVFDIWTGCAGDHTWTHATQTDKDECH
jgi:hypothetical protein